MTWSTRELADLAGTTVNTVRHYHALGLLDDPPRSHNGYKQYRVHHLIRLLRLRRLAELGIPLAEAGAVGGHERTIVLRRTDALLRDQIERIRRSQADIADILRTGAPVDTPRGFEALGARLSEADRALVHVCTQIYTPTTVSRLQLMIASESSALRDQLQTLTLDSSELERDHIAENLAAGGAHWRSPLWVGATEGESIPLHRTRIAEQTFIEALAALYNSAQRDVLQRADVALRTGAGTAELALKAG